MSPLLIALLGVMLVPLFVATWRTSLLGLGAQGLLMAWLAWQLGPEAKGTSEWLRLIDLGLVRGLVAPLALYGVLHLRGAPARNDVIPPNLLSWTLALAIVLVAFAMSDRLIAEPGPQQTLLSVAVTGLLLGFLVLATQSSPFSQIVGLLRIENAVALFELGGHHHDLPLGVQLGQMIVMVATIGLARWALRGLTGVADDDVVEAPTL